MSQHHFLGCHCPKCIVPQFPAASCSTSQASATGLELDDIHRFDALMWGGSSQIATLRAGELSSPVEDDAWIDNYSDSTVRNATLRAAADVAAVGGLGTDTGTGTGTFKGMRNRTGSVSTSMAPPVPEGTRGERTQRVQQMLADQYRKRPELDVNWVAFSLPELENFMRILQAEEETHRQQVGRNDGSELHKSLAINAGR